MEPVLLDMDRPPVQPFQVFEESQVSRRLPCVLREGQFLPVVLGLVPPPVAGDVVSPRVHGPSSPSSPQFPVDLQSTSSPPRSYLTTLQGPTQCSLTSRVTSPGSLSLSVFPPVPGDPRGPDLVTPEP